MAKLHIPSFGVWSSMFGHVKEALSENGVGSYSRYAGAAVTLSVIGWVSYIVAKTHALPDLGGAATLLAGGNAAYATNQAKKVAEAIKGAKPVDPTLPADPSISPDK